MKQIALLLLMSITPVFSFSQPTSTSWTPLSSSMFVMPSPENSSIMLSAGIDSRTADVAFRILDITGTICKEGFTGPPERMPPAKINDRFVKILAMCINGSRLVMPETEPGRTYFNDLINSGAPVTIEYDSSPTLHFRGKLPAELRQKLLDAKHAM